MWLLQRMGERLLRAVDRLQRAFHRSPPAFRRGAAMLVDALIVVESFAVVLIVRVNGDAEKPDFFLFWPFAVFSALAFVLLLNESGVYRSILRYTGIHQGVRVLSATAIAAGGRDNGGPGPRPDYGPGYYAAFLIDPGGNNVEAVCLAGAG